MTCRVSITGILLTAGAICAFGQPRLPAGTADASALSRGEALTRIASGLGYVPVDASSVKCGLPIHAALRARRSADPAEAARIAGLLFPRAERQTSILRSGWRIHFDTTGTHEPALLGAGGARIPGTARAFAESVGTTLSRVIAVEVDVLGYPAPAADGLLGGGPEPDIYIEDLGSLYGMTFPDVEGAAGATSTAFVTIDNDFSFVSPAANRGMPGMKVTVAHEFHHAVQLSRYGYWPNDVYYYEMTSTWLEDVVYTEVNDYLNYLWWFSSHFQMPTASFTSNDLVCYSRAIWCHFIARRFGADAIKRSWEEVSRQAPLGAIDAALRQSGSSFSLAFNEWTRWNYFTSGHADTLNCYPEGGAYPAMARLTRQFVSPVLTVQGGLEPLAARYHEVVIPRAGGGADTLTIAVSRVDPGAPSGIGDYTLTLRPVQLDESYRETGTSLYSLFSATSFAGWGVWYLSPGGSIQPYGLASLAEGTAFPNPFRPDGRSSVSIPVDASGAIEGNLQIYDAGLGLVYSSGDARSSGGVRQVFSWDGRTPAGNLVPTGIYLYILSLSDGKTMRGKIAVVRR